MAESLAGKFSCLGCGNRYTWKPELAGKRVKCKCGQALTVPLQMPGAAGNGAAPAAAKKEMPVVKPAIESKPVVAKPPVLPKPPLATPISRPAPVKPEPEPVPEGSDDGPSMDDLFALAEGVTAAQPIMEGGCPSCGANVIEGVVICVNCGHNFKTGAQMGTRMEDDVPMPGGLALAGGHVGTIGYASAPPARKKADDENFGEVLFDYKKDLYLPVAMIIVGVGLLFYTITLGRGIKNPAIAVLAVGILITIDLILMVPGVLYTIKLFDLGIGPLPTGIAKLSACAILPGAISELIKTKAQFFGGDLLAWGASYIMTLLLFMYLLDMDGFEAYMCSCIIWIIQTFIGYALLALILSGSFDGPSGNTPVNPTFAQAMGAGGNPAPAPPPPPPPGARFDERATELLGFPNKVDAKKWIMGNEQRTFNGRDHAASVEIVEKLLSMNVMKMLAVGVTDAPDQLACGYLVFDLPTKAADRKLVFGYVPTLKFVLHHDFEEPEDEGQKRMSIEFTEEFRPRRF